MRKIHSPRYACMLLDQLRSMHKTHNYSSMLPVVEELQVMYSNMEDALSIQKDFVRLDKDRKRLNKLIKKYEKEIGEKKPDMDKISEILEEMR